VSDWQAFLRARGARYDDDAITDFGDPEGELALASGGDLLAALGQLGVVTVSGAEAAALLQGQQTNDIREVTATHSQLGGICNSKGRLIATYRVVLRDGAYWLVTPRSQVATLAARLRGYVLRAKVSVSEDSGTTVLLGLQGAGAAIRAQSLLGELPPAVDDARHHRAATIVRLRGALPRFLILTSAQVAPELWDALAEASRPVGRAPWELSEIYAGVPEVYPETREAFVPQMLNYQAVGGVSFTKGCYTGQEVVARTQYLGKLKRRMYRAHVEGPAAPRPGQDLYSPADPSGQSVGKVVTAQAHPAGGYELLAVIQNEAALAPVHLGSADGPLLALGELPYPL
jgi:hypothetical protein